MFFSEEIHDSLAKKIMLTPLGRCLPGSLADLWVMDHQNVI